MNNADIPQPNSATTVSTTVAPASTPAPAPMVAQPMVASTPDPMMENGGATKSGGVGDFFKSLNWVEVGISILAVASLTYLIYYHRFKLKQDKMINNDLQRQIDELKMNMQSAMKGRYKSI